MEEEKVTHNAKTVMNSLTRKWLLTFLLLSFILCTFFTPWKILNRVNPTVYSFWGYSPIFSTYKNGERDFRSIDVSRLIMCETIIGILCAAGYIYQNKK